MRGEGDGASACPTPLSNRDALETMTLCDRRHGAATAAKRWWWPRRLRQRTRTARMRHLPRKCVATQAARCNDV